VTVLTKAPSLPDTPYPGIESFRFIDQPIFAAREDETWNLLSNILIYRGVLLYGDSGSGKSSLVNAGLIPAALDEKLIANRLRIQPRAGKEIKIERIAIESEDQPPYLESVFVTGSDGPASIEISLREFSERLERLKDEANRETRPLLIFDQFEEFITLFEETLRGGATAEAKQAQKEAPDVRRAILEALTALMEDEQLPVKLLFAFREDYLAKLNPLFLARPELLDQYVRLLAPRIEEAEKIIRAPFVNEEVKKNFVERSRGAGGKEISPALAKTIATQLENRSDSGLINLSELQTVCRKLWESPDPDKFFQAQDQDVQKVLEDYWADVLKTLGKLYDPAIALLGHMVTSSNTRNIVSEPDLKAQEKENFTDDQINDALEALVEHKLIRREPRHKIYFYEIASEFLVPWIQQKSAARLAEIEARKLGAETERKLEQAEKQKRSLWIGSSVLALLLVAAVVGGAIAVYSRKVAKKALQAADKAKADLTVEKDRSANLITLLNQLTAQDSKVRLAAVNKLIALDKSQSLPQSLPRDLVPVILAVSSKDPNDEVAKATSYFFTRALEESKTDVTSSILKSAETNAALTTSSKEPTRVYIQIATNDQRSRADKIANAVKGAGFVVAGIQLMDSSHSPSTNQVRFFKATAGTESVGPDPKDFLNVVMKADPQKWSLVPLPASIAGRPGHFEIWFAQPMVTLRLSFVDETGHEVAVTNPDVTLDPEPSGKQIFRTAAVLSAPAGKYTMHVQAKGYELFRSDITLQGKEVKQTISLHPSRIPLQQQMQQRMKQSAKP
jgi:hypothetical protein